MALAGKYELVRNEGIEEHMKANGIPEDRLKGFLADSNKIEIVISGDNITITRASGRNQTFVNNKEVTENVPDGAQIKSTAVLDGNTLKINTVSDRGTWKRLYVLSGSELVVTSISDKPGVADGKRIYKKL